MLPLGEISTLCFERSILLVERSGQYRSVGKAKDIGGRDVVKVDWCEEKKREQRRKESYPYTKRPGLLLHLNGVTLRHA
jgi:hypothetical protein